MPRPNILRVPQDGVSEGEFKAIIDLELDLIKSASFCFPLHVCAHGDISRVFTTSDACARLDFDPTITLVVVGKYHKVAFFPNAEADRDKKGNCLPGTVIDSDVVSPVEFDYYLYGHAGLLGTSKPAHYNVLVDENNFTFVVSRFYSGELMLMDGLLFALLLWVRGVHGIYRPDGIQSLSYALCHVYARCTRSVSIPAPIYCKFLFPLVCQPPSLFIHVQINSDAHNVCTRGKNHYDPQQVKRIFPSEMTGTEDTRDRAMARRDEESEYQSCFQQTHERQASRMYFV